MSLSQQILAALSGAPTQNDRLLVLHTVLGPDVLVVELAQIDEAIGPNTDRGAGSDGGADTGFHAGFNAGPVSALDAGVHAGRAAATGFRIVVHALAADTHLELKRLIGQPALIELLGSASRSALRPFHGHVTEAALLGSDGGLARFRLVIEPWLAFLAHRQDSRVFQRRTVVQIVEEVFAGYRAAGRLVPAWRWELADASVYAERSLCTQYQESDLAFVSRLLLEEGLFCWFEHRGESSEPALGAHTLVLADHNGAFAPSAQPQVRYTQSRAGLPEDSLVRWRHTASLQTAGLELASRDYRSLSLRPQSQGADPAAGAAPFHELELDDLPGAYAYEDAAQGERLALRQMQALDAAREHFEGRGTVRASAPGSSFTLSEHPRHDGSIESRDRFVTLAVRHRARNNLGADHRARLRSLPGAIRALNAQGSAGHTGHHRPGEAPGQTSDTARQDAPDAARGAGAGADAGLAPSPPRPGALPNDSDTPLYECRLRAQRAAVPVRLCALDEYGLPDPRLHRRPTMRGAQTAIVVGLGAPVHTDRDHRIKLQFHWQRGSNSSHRLTTSPAGAGEGRSEGGDGAVRDNAPASDASGTWVRVAQTVAGTNWGAVFTPRLGQEVLVQFVAGDIDRPVVVGSLYNGRGSADAQGNQVAGGAAGATGNAPAWFPGTRRANEMQGHQHGAVLSGYKSQELSSSQNGAAGYNQLVFDDSPGAGRIELSSTSAATRLQLGHLLNMNDNQRLQPRGHGLDLGTQAWGALRAGQGLLLSAHGRPGSQSAGSSLDSHEPRSQLEQSLQVLHALAESAQQLGAKGNGEPDVTGAKPGHDDQKLPNEQHLQTSIDGLDAVATRSAQTQEGADATGGGTGDVRAWPEPCLVVAAPGGIAALTPADTVMAAGGNLTIVAGQDMQHLAQANYATVVQSGLVFFTDGTATNSDKPNQETGIALHAASGNVNTQSQSGATRLTADQAIEVSSTTGVVKIAAPEHILLAAAGAAIEITSAGITLKGPGKIEFRATLKELTGGASASQSLGLKKPGKLRGCAKAMQASASSGAAV